VLVGLQGISLSYRHPACALRAVGAQGCARELQSNCGVLVQVQVGLGALGALDAARSRTELQGLGLRLGWCRWGWAGAERTPSVPDCTGQVHMGSVGLGNCLHCQAVLIKLIVCPGGRA
jgi:hypothetical protein